MQGLMQDVPLNLPSLIRHAEKLHPRKTVATKTPEGVKTETSDKSITERFVELHLDIGIQAMTEIGVKGEPIKHFTY